MAEPARVNLVPIISDELQVSRSEARRLINQGAVRVDAGLPVLDFDPLSSFVAGKTLLVGKRRTVDVPPEQEGAG
jgi:tyrosyl-tRNA synthetase